MASAFNDGKKGGNAAEDAQEESGAVAPNEAKKGGKVGKASKKRVAEEDGREDDEEDTLKKPKVEIEDDGH
jgi:hypothetical protein